MVTWRRNFSVAVWVSYIAIYDVAVQTGVVMVIYLHKALDKRLAQGGELTERDILAELENGTRAVLLGTVHRLETKRCGRYRYNSSQGFGDSEITDAC